MSEFMGDPSSPLCSRCGEEIVDDEEGRPELFVYSKTEAEFEADPSAGLGELVAAYCADCTAVIDARHREHEELLTLFRQEIDETLGGN
jgi:hypothetical protein